jgi:hypothetical protein
MAFLPPESPNGFIGASACRSPMCGSIPSLVTLTPCNSSVNCSTGASARRSQHQYETELQILDWQALRV